MKEKTPLSISTIVKKFCLNITHEATPTYVPVKTWEKAKKLECHINAQEYIKVFDCCTIVSGWMVLIYNPIFVEGQFHSVIRNEEQQLIDITPNQLGETKILFIEDRKAKYSGIGVNNIRMPLLKKNLIFEYLHLHDEYFDIINEGDLSKQFGEIKLNLLLIEYLILKIYLSIQNLYLQVQNAPVEVIKNIKLVAK